jgi:uncharacterized protein YoaH (UPF0181 family)
MGTPGVTEGAIPPPVLTTGQEQLLMPTLMFVNPYSSGWWTAQTITDIPNDAVGWLLAQGWQITSITYDETQNPKVPYYTMARQSLQTANILYSLVESYADSYNKALEANSIRYNDVIESWSELIVNTDAHLATQAEEQNDHYTLYDAALDFNMDAVDVLINDNQSKLVTDTDNAIDATTAASALTEMNDKLPDLETNVDDKETTISGYLTDLGTTELARINEKYAASLATQLQQLSDQGMYSSGRAIDITARNTRDREEEIATTNDRLNREKWENEHRILGHRQDAVKGFMAGKERFSVITMQNASTLAEHRHKAIQEKMNESAVRIAGLQTKHEETMKLMAYMLAEHNQLVVGLFDFVEKRTDAYPSFDSFTQLCVGLGDSGGGWVSP